jgi:hypothetical protein
MQQRAGEMREAGLECAGPLQIRARGLVVPAVGPERTAVEQCFGEIGLDGERTVVARQRFGVASEAVERDATVVERLGVVGPERQRGIAARQRPLESA